LSGTPAPFETAYATVNLIARCKDVNVDMLALQPGTFADCPGHFIGERYAAQCRPYHNIYFFFGKLFGELLGKFPGNIRIL
jgi:hypothetical protein